jgi:hypothetical protein
MTRMYKGVNRIEGERRGDMREEEVADVTTGETVGSAKL